MFVPPNAFESPNSRLYDDLTHHQTHQTDWDHRPIIAELHRFREIFDSEFKLELAPTVFRIGGAHSTCYGHFRPGHNQFGLTREIAFTDRHLRLRLAAGEFYLVLGTELHELLHAWQFDHGTPSSWGHHNQEFRVKAQSLGLRVDKRGVTEYEPHSPFFSVHEKYGLQIPPAAKNGLRGIHDAFGNGSKLRKWSCQCVVVGQWADRTGLTAYSHFPSLAQHVGDRTTLWENAEDNYPRRAPSFVGEAFPALDFPISQSASLQKSSSPTPTLAELSHVPVRLQRTSNSHEMEGRDQWIDQQGPVQQLQRH